MPRTFPCPRCGQPSHWENNPFRPFCSERCKLIDLGAWASEDYKIPTQDSPGSEQKHPDDYDD
ncbi:DNA gyrase inhibitor YacG [Acinetobacter sp. V89_7]|uniref:DNA gyrase inhibitor YacG n=1 Tax=Acinetobacter sp. V89_7 TaxID=3044233 RepID=UPI00249D927D|nr:DNA gyrase inhibitor YacG [Acinetobacter sp. V89_7]MDI3376919.1 DNA gyrase inhibitor YacG [Acinetobacter sp. V89_7]